MTQVATRAASAVASLQSLKTGLQNVSSTIVTAGGDPFLRLLRDGTWVYGQENVEVEAGSYWAVNPLSLKHGWVSWTDHKGKPNEIVGEIMVPMTAPLPLQTQLNETGWPWTQQLQFNMACVTGEDQGEQTLYKTTSVGGMNAMKKVIAAIMAQLDRDPDRPVPIIELMTDHYQHKTWGKTYVPVFEIVKWSAMDDDKFVDEAEAEPEEPKAEEPKPAARTRTRAAAAPKEEPAPAAPEPEETPAERRKRELMEELAALEGKGEQDAAATENSAGSGAGSAEPVRRRRRG